ncbi:hypothetical protein LINGRAHAP2_LOCUS27894 [Linum grandiflorum]
MVDYIHGLPPTQIVDLHPFLISTARVALVDKALELVFLVPKLQYMLFTRARTAVIRRSENPFPDSHLPN